MRHSTPPRKEPERIERMVVTAMHIIHATIQRAQLVRNGVLPGPKPEYESDPESPTYN